jgi:hypothetical protein
MSRHIRNFHAPVTARPYLWIADGRVDGPP